MKIGIRKISVKVFVIGSRVKVIIVVMLYIVLVIVCIYYRLG